MNSWSCDVEPVFQLVVEDKRGIKLPRCTEPVIEKLPVEPGKQFQNSELCSTPPE